MHLFVLLQEATLQTKPLDATVGRLIVQCISDPVAVLRSLSQLVRPGGVLAFQDVSYVKKDLRDFMKATAIEEINASLYPGQEPKQSKKNRRIAEGKIEAFIKARDVAKTAKVLGVSPDASTSSRRRSNCVAGLLLLENEKSSL